MIRVAALLGLVGCGSMDPWVLDGIHAGDAQFDSKRLSYLPAGGYPPWKIEFFREGGEILAFVSLVQYGFRSEGLVKVGLEVQGKSVYEEEASVLAGGMRVQFSKGFTSALIQALQEGEKVSILVDGWQETLETVSFKKNFAKLLDDSPEWQLIQTPLK